MKRTLIFIIFLLIIIPLANLEAQIAIPKGYFSSPLNIPLSISGSFSEVRPNHFHSGTDFQVQQKEGLPIFAVADGFVSRIKVSPVGFGNALYIDHPNGFTSVYGHLKAYSDTITEYVRANQYKVKSFEVDLFPALKKEFIYVKKGQLIGYAGNSGASGGAHLHFELRNTKTEHIINPILFGFDINDKFPPIIDFIKIYPEKEGSFIENSSEATRFNLKKINNREYHLTAKDTLIVWGDVSIGAQAFDFNQNQTDRNGFYSMKMFCDQAPFFTMVCDSFGFDESRFVNASIDYAANYNLGNRIVKSKKLPGNLLSFFGSDQRNGILSLTDGNIHEIDIAISDEAGNYVNLQFWLKSQRPTKLIEIPLIEITDSTMIFKYNRFNKFENKEVKVDLPVGSLYDNLVFNYRKAPASKTMFSDIHYLHNPEVPLHSRIKVSIKANNLPQSLRPKALLVRIDRDGKRSSAGGSYENGYVTASTNLFDGYAIAVDTTAPVIKPYPENAKNKTELRYTVSDNLSGIKSYKGEVNGQWVLVEWDPKNRLMLYRFDKIAQPGKNTFTLQLEDEKGNKKKYSTTFKR
jgi:hypothetical protein